MSGELSFIVPDDREGSRLDRFLADSLGTKSSRSQIQKWIKAGHVQSAGVALNSSHAVQAGESIHVSVPDVVMPDVEPMEMDFPILFEDDEMAVIIKPPGIAVHPGIKDAGKTLINGLLFRWKDLENVGEDFRPGIVHRLDSDTEGLLLVAKTTRAHRILSEQFQTRTIEKEYAAWLLATPKEPKGRIELPIARNPRERLKMRVDPEGRPAVTEYEVDRIKVSKHGRKFALVKIRLITGRTHQIRVHFSHIGCPVVGDPLYSRSSRDFLKFGLLLLARRIRFTHPSSGETMEFSLDLPERFADFERLCENY